MRFQRSLKRCKQCSVSFSGRRKRVTPLVSLLHTISSVYVETCPTKSLSSLQVWRCTPLHPAFGQLTWYLYTAPSCPASPRLSKAVRSSDSTSFWSVLSVSCPCSLSVSCSNPNPLVKACCLSLVYACRLCLVHFSVSLHALCLSLGRLPKPRCPSIFPRNIRFFFLLSNI